jgi:hypothetical protein
MILALAGLGEASRGTGNAAFVRKLIPGGRAWQRIPALVEPSRPGRQARRDQRRESAGRSRGLRGLMAQSVMAGVGDEAHHAATVCEHWQRPMRSHGDLSPILCGPLTRVDERKVASRSGCSARLGGARWEPADVSSVLFAARHSFAARRLAGVRTRKVRAGRAGEPVGSWAPKSFL